MPIDATEYIIPVAPSHTFDGPVIVPAASGNGFTIIEIVFDIAGLPVEHCASDVNSHVT